MSETSEIATQEQTVKRALCINTIEDLIALIKGENETIDTRFVDRKICEDVSMGYLQIIPYVTFYTTDVEEGKLHIVQYLRAAGINEDRLLSKTSIGFGGHIDSEDDMEGGIRVPMEDGNNMYVLTKNELLGSIFKAAERELQEELSLNVKDVFGIDYTEADARNVVFFTGSPEEEVNRVHLGAAILFKLTNEQFEKFFEVISVNKDEIELVSRMTINLASIIEDMNSTVIIESIKNELRSKNNTEDWSLQVLELIIKTEINDIMAPINYHHLLELSKQLKAIGNIHHSLVEKAVETEADQEEVTSTEE